LKAVKGDEDLLVVTNKGVIIRVSLEQVKVASRNTQGVRIIKIADNAVVSSIAVVDKTEDALDETNKETVSEVE
jgi:DNA gyrase subunit A